MILMALALLLAVLGRGCWAKWKADQSRHALAAQFRASLQNLVFALRGGVSLPQAIEYVAHEGQEPMAQHWRQFCQSLQVGRTLPEALEELCQSLQLREVQWFAAAVLVTKSTGGSLADVLDTLSESLREQQALRDRVRALTAQGKASGILLSALPFVVLGALTLMAPEIARPLFATWAGQGLLGVILFLVATGGWFVYKIVTVPLS